jgi:hypothetical protein
LAILGTDLKPIPVTDGSAGVICFGALASVAYGVDVVRPESCFVIINLVVFWST